MLYRISRFILFVLLKSFFRFKIEGRGNIPGKGGFILVCNHESYLDPAVLGVGCRRTVSFMARDTLFNNHLLGYWMRLVNVIPVKRGIADFSAIKSALRIVRKGKGLAIFPEGTRRTPDKAFINPEPGAGFLADRGNVPVIPAFIFGTREALPKGVNKKVHFGKTILVRFGKEIHIERGKPYHEISEMIMASIKELSMKNS